MPPKSSGNWIRPTNPLTVKLEILYYNFKGIFFIRRILMNKHSSGRNSYESWIQYELRSLRKLIFSISQYPYLKNSPKLFPSSRAVVTIAIFDVSPIKIAPQIILFLKKYCSNVAFLSSLISNVLYSTSF